jgi:hypothetical protein
MPAKDAVVGVIDEEAPAQNSLLLQIAMATPEERAAIAALLGSAPAVVEEPLPPRPVETSPDKELDKPIRFWNDRYRFEGVYINGKKRKFINGQFIARTERERDRIRQMGKHVYEGDNVTEPIRCKTCRREFMNSLVALDHMDRHAVA